MCDFNYENEKLMVLCEFRRREKKNIKIETSTTIFRFLLFFFSNFRKLKKEKKTFGWREEKNQKKFSDKQKKKKGSHVIPHNVLDLEFRYSII